MSALDDLDELAALLGDDDGLGAVRSVLEGGHEPIDDAADENDRDELRGASLARGDADRGWHERYPQQDARRVRVRRDPDGRWRSVLRDRNADELVGYYADQHTAVVRGITALRFVAAGVPWRAEL